jgi:hypothetical protein
MSKTRSQRLLRIDEREVSSVNEIVEAFEKQDLLHDERRDLLMRGEDSADFAPTAGISRAGNS